MLPGREDRTGKGCFIPVFVGGGEVEEGDLESVGSGGVGEWRRKVVGWEGRPPSSLAVKEGKVEEEVTIPERTGSRLGVWSHAYGGGRRKSERSDSGVDVRSLPGRRSPLKSRWSDDGDDVRLAYADSDSTRVSVAPVMTPDLLLMSGWRGAAQEW